jgi:hypothetical protein
MADASESGRSERAYAKMYSSSDQVKALVEKGCDAVRGSDPSTVSTQLLGVLLPDLQAFPTDEDVDTGSSLEDQIKVRYKLFKTQDDLNATSAQVLGLVKIHISQGYIYATVSDARAAKIEGVCDVHIGLADWVRVEGVDPSVRNLRQFAFKAGQDLYYESSFYKLRQESKAELAAAKAAPVVTEVSTTLGKMITIPLKATKGQMKAYLSTMMRAAPVNLDYVKLHESLRNQPSMADEFNLYLREKTEQDVKDGKPDLAQSVYVLGFLKQQQERLSSLSLHESAMAKVNHLKQGRDETSTDFLGRASNAIAHAFSLGSDAGQIDSRLQTEEERCRLVVNAMNEPLRKEVRKYINQMKQKEGGDSRFGNNSFLDWTDMQKQVVDLATAAELDTQQDLDDTFEHLAVKPRAVQQWRRPEARSVVAPELQEQQRESGGRGGGRAEGGRGGYRGGDRRDEDRGRGYGGYRGGDRRDDDRGRGYEGYRGGDRRDGFRGDQRDDYRERGRRGDSRDRRGDSRDRRGDSRDRGPREEDRKIFCFDIPHQQGFTKSDGLCMPPLDAQSKLQCMYHFHGKKCAFADNCRYSHNLKLVHGEVLTARTIKRRTAREESGGRKDSSDAGSSASGAIERAKYRKEQVKNVALVKEVKELKRSAAAAAKGKSFHGEGNNCRGRDQDSQHDDDDFSALDEGDESGN